MFSVGNTNHVVLALLAALISHNWITVKLTLGYTRELIPQVSLNWVKSFPATFNNRSINSHRYEQLSLEWWHNYCGYWPKCKIHNFYRTCGSVTCSTFLPHQYLFFLKTNPSPFYTNLNLFCIFLLTICFVLCLMILFH